MLIFNRRSWGQREEGLSDRALEKQSQRLGSVTETGLHEGAEVRLGLELGKKAEVRL